jgi:hypothetical protein
MATAIAKQNGTAKKETTVVKKQVQKKLAKEATGQKPTPVKETPKIETPIINLDEKINRFEKLRGLANNRELVARKLTEMSKFNYNNDGSSTFYVRDASGNEFKTTNSNLIKMVTSQLQGILQQKKQDIEQQIIVFEL